MSKRLSFARASIAGLGFAAAASVFAPTDAQAGCHVRVQTGNKVLAWVTLGYQGQKDEARFIKKLEGPLGQHPVLREFLQKSGTLKGFRGVYKKCEELAEIALVFSKEKHPKMALKASFRLEVCNIDDKLANDPRNKVLVSELKSQKGKYCGLQWKYV